MSVSSQSVATQSSAPVRIGGRYELLRCLARGGMGDVFLARELATSRAVALKRLLPSAKKRHALFRAEYHALARLKHPFIIEVYDFGLDGDLPYYSMELLDGYDLRESPLVSVAEGCHMLRDVACSLALLHAQRLLHRDVSPRNVRRTSSGVSKLIDFGTMVPFGVPPNLAGTSPFIAPEALEGAALDQRADLYSLGAVAYWLFSRRLPGVAQALGHARASAEPPTALRRLAKEVPTELDELVMSMLDSDPSRRPSSAQEVIARLSVIGNLPASDSARLADAHFGSSRFVGQARARRRAEQLVRGALVCRGRGALVEGPAGSGKTRFLQEFSLLAQTRGFAVVRALASRHASSRNLARQLYRGIRRAAPEALQLVAAEEREVLAALERKRPLGSSAAEAELRGRTLWALAAYLRVVTKQMPWLLVVDDLDLADEASVGIVTALAAAAENLPLVVVGSVCSDRALSSSVATFSHRSQRIRLRHFSRRRTRAFVSDLVGPISNRARLVDYLFRGAHGNPGRTIELCRYLVTRGVIGYTDGSFVLPEGDIRTPPPPLSFRLEGLSTEARELLQLLAMCRAGASLDLCLEASEASSEDVLNAVHELLSRGVLIGSGDAYVFAQEALRSAIRHALGDQEKQRLHERLASALAVGSEQSALMQLEAALHLVETERELQGALTLVELVPPLIESGIAAADAIAGLEKALEVLERRGASLALRLSVRTHLARASYTHDYRLADRYAADTTTLLRNWLAMPFLSRLRRVLPGPCVALLALLLVAARWVVSPRKVRGPGPVATLQSLARVTMSTLGVHLTALNRAEGQRALDQMWLFRDLPLFKGATALYQAASTLLLQTQGREGLLRERAAAALRSLERPVPLMHEPERQDLRVGLMLSAGMNEAYRLGSTALAQADALAATGTHIAAACAHRIRFAYFAVRGMREQAEEHRRQLDIHGLSGGTTWQVEWFALPMEGMTNALYGDLGLAAQALSRLEQLSAEVPSLALLRDMLRIGNLLRRGELEETITLGRDYVARHPPGSLIGWGTVYAAVASALNRSGRHGEALELCEGALRSLSTDDLEYDHMYGGLLCEQAVACAGSGDVARALEISEQHTARIEAAGEWALLAYALDARARLAQLAGNAQLLVGATCAMRAAAERTGSSAVVEHVAKLVQARLRGTEDEAEEPLVGLLVEDASTGVATPPRGLGRTRGRTLLWRLMQQARAHAALVLAVDEPDEAPWVAAAAGDARRMDPLLPAVIARLRSLELDRDLGGAAAPSADEADWSLRSLRPNDGRAPGLWLLLGEKPGARGELSSTLLDRLTERVSAGLGSGEDSSESLSHSESSHTSEP